MCTTRVLHPIAPSSVNFYTPVNAVIKNSDKNRAQAIVIDIERYFHSYPTAHNDRDSFCIQYQGVSWCYSNCCFGHAACPYYTSTFGAEYHRWFSYIYRILNSYVVDDWFTAAATLALCLGPMRIISNVFESCGFTMNADKFKYGQQIVFLGILIDSVSMTVRFDPI